MHPVTELAAALRSATALVAFTGAGVSTESGIPDFRSPGGLWTRFDPRVLTFSRYVASAEVRSLAWQLRREFWAADPQPNAAHRALAALEASGCSLGVVTQNIDGLHQAAGSATVIELHGTSREVMCIGAAPRTGTPDGCGWRAPTAWAFDRLDSGDLDPRCPVCAGLVKSATVSFGQNLFPGMLDRAQELVLSADLVLAIGSSLAVHPAAGLPEAAADAGIPLVILNDEPTPLDDRATLVVRGRAAEVLPQALTASPRVDRLQDSGSRRRTRPPGGHEPEP